jgi:transcriptional regulator GlxA family with amidase domain
MRPAGHTAVRRRIGLLIYDNITMIDVAGPADVFSNANMFGGDYEIVLVSVDGSDATASNGLTLRADASATDITALDTVIVPGAYGMIDRPFGPELLGSVRVLAERAVRVASACTGAFLLAEIGLLDGRRATTHWKHIDRLGRLYPRVRVEPDSLFVRDGSMITSAGISSGIDLALALVEDDLGAEVARKIARHMIIFMQRPGGQSQFSAASRASVPAEHPLRALLDTIAADPAGNYSLARMASLAAVSPRTLTRMFRDRLRTTPARYVELIRIESAQTLLRNGTTVAQAARASGFGSAETLRRVFVSRVGLTPSVYAETTARHT